MNRRQYIKSSLAISATCLWGKYAMALAQQSSATQLSKQLRFNIALKNLSDKPLLSPQFWMALPANVGQQTLKSIKVSSNHTLESDVLGLNVIQFELPDIGPYATKLLNLVTEVEWHQTSNVKVSSSEQWLSHEHLIEIEYPGIKDLAKQLKRQDAINTCMAIYDWVSVNMHYSGYVADNLGARYALTNLKGDCTEYACLAVALARANNIPARMVGGYYLNEGHTVKARDYHHWAEVYVDENWHLLDAQKKNWQRNQHEYVVYDFYQTWQPTILGLSKRYKASSKLRVSY